MNMVVVQSSNVARVGHEGTKLRVEFHDGKVYQWDDISHELYIALLTASSKGKFVARFLGKGMPLIQTYDPQTYEVNSMRPECADQFGLQTYEPDSCCGARLSKAMSSGQLASATSWECPECGCTWKPEQVGPIRHWSPVPMIAVFK